MESKRKAEVLENEEKRPRREHTSLLQLLQQVEQHTMPTGTDYHVRHCPVTPFQQSRPYPVSGFQQLVELGSIRVDGRERDAEEVLEECVNTIDQTLKEIADIDSLEVRSAFLDAARATRVSSRSTLRVPRRRRLSRGWTQRWILSCKESTPLWRRRSSSRHEQIFT